VKLLLSGFLLCVFALTVLADTDLTGKWSGSFKITAPNGETNDTTAFLVLKQSGSDITGTAGPSEDEQYPITKGKIDGDKITMELDHEGHMVKLDLVLVADRITGDASMSAEDGGTVKAKVDVGRVK
jgi:hypothetical protein